MAKTTELTVVAPQSLTKKAMAEGNKRWKDRIAHFRTKRVKMGESILLLHWDEGKFIEELTQKPGHYGNNTVLHYANAQGVSRESAQFYRRFFNLFDKSRVRELAAHGITWRDTTHVIGVGDKEEREVLLTKLVKQEITSEELEIAVKKINVSIKARKVQRGEKVDGRGGLKFRNILKGVISSTGEMGRRVDNMRVGFRQFAKAPDGKSKSAQAAQLQSAFKELESLRKKIDAMLKFKA